MGWIRYFENQSKNPDRISTPRATDTNNWKILKIRNVMILSYFWGVIEKFNQHHPIPLENIDKYAKQIEESSNCFDRIQIKLKYYEFLRVTTIWTAGTVLKKETL
jgi:hypothetical protein